MAYTDYDFYISLYGAEDIQEFDFNRLAWDASRKMDAATAGVDGVKKLKVAFPTDEDSAEAVRRCACSLVHTMHQIEEAEKSAGQGRGYAETENGLRGKVISSVSAGNESISYATISTGSATMIDKALSDKAVRDQIFRETISEYLSGITDANGVNLLYMGRYPYNT